MEIIPTKMLRRCARISLATCSRNPVWARCRHFSFVLDGNRIVAVGTNTRKTHPANLLYGYVNRSMESISSLVGTHSELRAALLAGPENCRGLTLVNVRVDRNGRLAQSRPCRGCEEMIREAGFSEVWHTDDEGGWNRLGRQDPLGVPATNKRQKRFQTRAPANAPWSA